MKKVEVHYFVVSSRCDTCKGQSVHVFKKDCEEREKGMRYVYYIELCTKCWHANVEQPAKLCRITKQAWGEFVLTCLN